MKSLTIAERHDGSEVLLHGFKAAVTEQIETYRALVGRSSHPEFASVTRIDTLGTVKALRFTPESLPASTPAPEVEPLPAPTPTKGKKGSKIQVHETTEIQSK